MEYKQYLQSKERKDFAKQFKKGKSCERCGANTKLVVHHKTYEHIGKEKGNEGDLMVLCIGCHFKEHFGYKHYKNSDKYVRWQINNFVKFNGYIGNDLINKIGDNYFGCLMCLILKISWDGEINPKTLLTNEYMKKSKYYNFMQCMYDYNIIHKQKLKYETKYYINPAIATKGNLISIDIVNLFKQGYDWNNALHLG